MALFSFIFLQQLEAQVDTGIFNSLLEISLTVFILAIVAYFGFRYFTKELDKRDAVVKEKDERINNLNDKISGMIADITESNNVISNMMDKLLQEQMRAQQEDVREGERRTAEIKQEIKNAINDLKNIIDRIEQKLTSR